MEITFRALEKQDLKELENVVRKTWDYDKFASKRTAARLARVYLASCLTNQTYARVAVADGVPAGLILGKAIGKHRCPLRYRFRQIFALLSLALTREGRRIMGFYKGVDEVDRRLLKESGRVYQGEVALFALDPRFRGKGIGRKLFEDLVEYMEGEDIREFYLYTDTSCNFGFYEHLGMKRRGRIRKVVEMLGRMAEVEFYLYDYRLENED